MSETHLAPLRAFIAGKTNTGKSHLALTGGRTLVLYGDRIGGDEDLRGLEPKGIYVRSIDRARPRESFLKLVDTARDRWIDEWKLDTIVWDSCTYAQMDQRSASTDRNLNLMDQNRHGQVGNSILDMFYALTALPTNILILAHLKMVPVYGPGKGRDRPIVGEIWQPDMQALTYNAIARECNLMGYTWKTPAAVEGQDNTYGVCFLTQGKRPEGGIRHFADAKAPNGWGSREPADIRAWQRRLQADIDKRREAALAAIDNIAEKPPDDPQPVEEAAPAATAASTTSEEQLP